MVLDNIKILKKGANVLRKKAKIVPLSQIQTAETKKIIKNMRIALEHEKDGVAIAAPQIGISKRIFVVSPRAFMGHLIDANEEEIKEARKKILETEHLIFINPKIIKVSKEKREEEEGCLSVRWLYGKVLRATRATVSAYDQNGKRFERGASGLIAQIFQHETDHLDGILFSDKAKDLRDIPPAKTD